MKHMSATPSCVFPSIRSVISDCILLNCIAKLHYAKVTQIYRPYNRIFLLSVFLVNNNFQFPIFCIIDMDNMTNNRTTAWCRHMRKKWNVIISSRIRKANKLTHNLVKCLRFFVRNKTIYCKTGNVNEQVMLTNLTSGMGSLIFLPRQQLYPINNYIPSTIISQ